MIAVKDLPPPADRYPIRRALLSVSDKAGVADFARRLHEAGVELLSTGGTARALREAGLPVLDVAEVTGSPELLDGRVKTLHPRVHAGLLARRTDPEDLAQLGEHGIGPIDLVVVNLYPFREATAGGARDDVAAENVDIGGPTMLRAAAKNFAFVGAVVDPADYDRVAGAVEEHGSLDLAERRRLATKTFRHTADYDAAIAGFFEQDRADQAQEDEAMPSTFALQVPRKLALRYGENPHQAGAFYAEQVPFETLHGKALSYNNLLDLSGALGLLAEFADAPPTVAILKHTNPCGVGQAEGLEAAYHRAFATDRQSPFGGIVAVNRALDRATAESIDAVFTEIIIAPDFEDGVLDFLRQKKNRRLVRVEDLRAGASGALARLDVRTAAGGLLVQHTDGPLASAGAFRAACEVVTERKPTAGEWDALDFGWRVCKHVKSNAIVYASTDGQTVGTLGIGAGQMSRIDASETAVRKGAKSDLDFAGSAVASDAFFPFADGLLAAADAGATCAVQPGGSVRDDEVIAAANERGMAMVFTGRRHFRH
jgi:phosphoribosylaminoimidazolecarboxamide formyltransferase/IMP cyclohydrolase